MNPEADGDSVGQRGELTPQEAAEASVPFNYAPRPPWTRGRIEEDWAVRGSATCRPRTRGTGSGLRHIAVGRV